MVDFSPTKGAAEFVGVPLTINNSTNLIYTLATGTSAAGATFGTATNLTVPSYNAPVNGGAQPDGTLDLDVGDGRIPTHGYQVGNDVWLVQPINVTNNGNNRTGIAWYRINYNGGGIPTLVASGLLQDSTGHFDYFNPSVAANVNGDVVISFTRSGDSTTGTAGRAGAYADVGFTTGTTTTFGSPMLLQAGLTNGYHLFGGPGERWGDYSTVSVDPSDQGNFWLINEYAVNSATWADNISALSIQRTVIWSGGGSNNNWSTLANWDKLPTDDDSLIFAGSTRLANMNDSLTSVGSIAFSNTAGAFVLSGTAMTIAGGITNNSANVQTIDLNLTLGAAQQFSAASGNLIIGGAVATAGNTLTLTGGFNSTISGAISGAGGLIKSGSGTLTLSANSSYTGGTTVNGGTLIVSHVHGLGQSTTNGLTINNTALAKITTGTGAGPVVLPSLNINGGTSPVATLDITSSKMVITNTSFAAAQTAYSTAHAQVANAFDGFAWDLPGITSSQVQTDFNVNGIPTAVGIVLNNDTAGGNLFYGDGTGGFPQFAGTSVDQNSILFKYTYIGDSNLDGMVDSTDFGLFLAGYNDPGTAASLGWAVGDYDYSSTVDSTDFGLFLAGYNYYASNPVPLNGAGGVQAVPEPAAICLAIWGGIGALLTVTSAAEKGLEKLERKP